MNLMLITCCNPEWIKYLYMCNFLEFLIDSCTALSIVLKELYIWNQCNIIATLLRMSIIFV